MSDGPRGGLGRKAAVGFLASASSQAGRTGLQVASVVVLGRLLSPRDYGLMAMVMAVLGLADMLRDMGLSTVAIQAKTLTAAQRNNLWLINTMIGAGLMVLTILVSPLFAWGYGQPETAWIACAMAPNFLLSAMQTQYRAGFTRELRFTFISMVDFLSTLVGLLLGTFLALLGSGYWALVGQTLLTTVLALVAVAIKADWRPRGFIRMSGTMALIKKGLSFFASMVMSYVATNLDSVIIGRVAGADALGLYNRAAQLIRVPFRQIQSPAGAVMMPTMSRIQHDHVRLRRAMQLQQSAVSYPLAIVAVIVAAAPADLVRLALGEQWISAAPLMAVVAASAAIGSISTPVSTVLTAMGLSKELARLTAMTATLNIAAIIIGAQWGGDRCRGRSGRQLLGDEAGPLLDALPGRRFRRAERPSGGIPPAGGGWDRLGRCVVVDARRAGMAIHRASAHSHGGDALGLCCPGSDQALSAGHARRDQDHSHRPASPAPGSRWHTRR